MNHLKYVPGATKETIIIHSNLPVRLARFWNMRIKCKFLKFGNYYYSYYNYYVINCCYVYYRTHCETSRGSDKNK